MVHLISEIIPANAIKHSIYANIYNEASPCLIINKIHRLEFYVINSMVNDHEGEQPSLQLVDELCIDEPILAINKFQHANLASECLLLLTETYQLLFLYYDGDLGRFDVIYTIRFDAHNQQLPSDLLPKIEVDPSPVPKYFLVYFFEGFLQTFTINHDWKPSYSTNNHNHTNTNVNINNKNKRKLESDIVDYKSFSIGGVIVVDLKILRGQENNVVIILYRDYNFNYSARYYKISDNNKFELIKQFEEFTEIPTALITPLDGGVISLTDNYLFYFPNNEKLKLSISNDNQDSTISINQNPNNMVITKRLVSINKHDVSAFNVCTVIDHKRILLIDNKGETFILFFDCSKTNKSLIIESISFIKLGITTIPLTIHHINENLFFVSSKLSQSLLFRILPQEPFINICQFLSTSPPILNIQANYNGLNFELLTCQGGYECGEFRRISNRSKSINLKFRFQTKILSRKLTVIDDEKFMVCNGNHCQTIDIKADKYKFLESKTFNALDYKQDQDVNSLKIESNTIELNHNIIFNGVVVLYKVLNTHTFIFLDDTKTIHVFHRGKPLQRIKVLGEVSNIDFMHVFQKEYLILVTFWDGSYHLYSISDLENEIILEEKLLPNIEAYATSCCIVKDAERLGNCWLLFVTSNNDVVEMYYNFQTLTKDINKNNITHFNGLPFKLKKHQNKVILFNQDHLFGFNNEVFPFDVSLEINDVEFLNNDHLIVASNTNDILVYNLGDMTMDKDVIFSNDFNLKSIKVGDELIILSSKNTFIDKFNEYSRSSFLQLVDLERMKVADVFEFPDHDPIEMVDILPLPFTEEDEEDDEDDDEGQDDNKSISVDISEFRLSSSVSFPQGSFIGICNTTNTNEMLKMFQIKDSKIIEVCKINIQGINDASKLTAGSIKIFDHRKLIFMVTGTINYLIQPKTLEEWAIVPDTYYKSPMFSIASAITKKSFILGDVMKGLTSVPYTSDKIKLGDARHYLDTNFLTDLVVVDYQNSDLIVTTDSFGNIQGIALDDETSTKFEPIFSVNIGETINTIIKIPNIKRSLDFTSNFDNFEPKKLLASKTILGTVNGGIYQISELLEDDDETDYEPIESTITECQKELIIFKHTLSDIQYSNKRDKYHRWMEKRGQRLLQQDETGEFITQSVQGIIDVRLIQSWLTRDEQLRVHGDRDPQDQIELDNMTKGLKKCYEHKNLLQRLVHEVRI